MEYVLTGELCVLEACNYKNNTALNHVSLCLKDSSIKKLWEFETVGSGGLVENLKKHTQYLKAVEEFKRNIKILPTDRCQLCISFE